MSERAFHMNEAEVGPMREIDAQALRGILDGSIQVRDGQLNLSGGMYLRLEGAGWITTRPGNIVVTPAGREALQRYEEGRA